MGCRNIRRGVGGNPPIEDKILLLQIPERNVAAILSQQIKVIGRGDMDIVVVIEDLIGDEQFEVIFLIKLAY